MPLLVMDIHAPRAAVIARKASLARSEGASIGETESGETRRGSEYTLTQVRAAMKWIGESISRRSPPP